MAPLKAFNLLVLLVIELAVLGAAVAFGWHLHAPVAARLAVGVLLALPFALAWGLAAAPRAKNRLTGLRLAGFEVLWFAAGAALLLAAGHPGWAAALGMVTLGSKSLALAWGQ
ncbi:MAG TPA: YrdB family protein [Actinocrinis sp.]|uniref:YrdB family protein n=1 Tax=Actinocrinis sp. TaxID=1920516 RepID=UPI002D2D2911|nr:YrdB family protein [Actinocrinis sp.]HZU55346.1 YrdB family protein [Actinocrinis sp.]